MSSAPQPRKARIAYRSAVNAVAHLLQLAWHLDKLKVLTYSFGAALEISGTLASTYAGAQLFSLLLTATQHPAQRHKVWFWLAVTIMGQLAINIGFWLMNYSKRLIHLLASKWAALVFMRQLCLIDIQMFHDTDSRNMINKLNDGYSWQMSQACANTLDLVYACVRGIAIIVVVATVAWWIAPFLVIFLIPSLIAETKTAKAGWFVWDEKGDERHIFWGVTFLMARARHQLEIRALQTKTKLLGTLDDMLSSFQLKQKTILRQANWIIGPAKVFEIIGIALTEIWLLVRLLYRHNLSTSSYFFYSGIIARINGALNTVVGSYTNMQEALLYAQDFFAFQQLQPTVVSDENAGLELSADEIPEICFKDVWFRYPGSQRWIFRGLNFTIKPGEHIALIGENGAGKTTLVKLLLRFYDIEKGAIEVNGHDLRQLNIASWYRQLGTLFQQFNEYPLDVALNITISRPGKVNEARFKEALADSGVDGIVAALPYGLETVLDSSFKKGVEPSGGQWQRVALGRAFYRNANVLILDEPTAAIDAKAEYEIFNSIFNRQAHKTAIIISHRFSTVRRADRIIVLKQGKIIEEGTHEELMRYPDGLYKDMFDKQAEGYR